MIGGEHDERTEISMNKMADYWEFLSPEDKQFILGVLKYRDPAKYGNLHVAHLVLLKFRTIKRAIRNTRTIWDADWSTGNISNAAYIRKFNSARKRVLKRLSPELLTKEQTRRWREQQKRG